MNRLFSFIMEAIMPERRGNVSCDRRETERGADTGKSAWGKEAAGRLS